MNYQKERNLSENEIQSLYDQTQTNLKIMKGCLKHNRSIMKEFGIATCEYGDKLEEISKRTIQEMMKINTNKILKEMSFQIKQIGSQIVGTSAAIKELINPINDESKSLKLSYNDYVKLIQQRKKDQEEQYKKLDEVKTKIGVYQRSIMPTDRQMTSQYRQMKQQENMMIEEQKLRYQQVVQCKQDLSNFILDENRNIEKKINNLQSKCYEYIYGCLELYNKKFNQIAQIKQLLDGSIINQNQSIIKSNINQQQNNSSHIKSNYNQQDYSPYKKNINLQNNLSSIIKNNNSQSPISKQTNQQSRILTQINNFDYRSISPQQKTPNKSIIQQKSNINNNELVESEDLSEIENKSNRSQKQQYLSTIAYTNQTKIKKSQISNNSSNKSENTSKGSLYQCKQFKSNQQSINNNEYI